MTLKVLHQRLTTSRQLSDHDDAKLARVADELASVARDLHPELGGPPDPKAALAASQSLQSLALLGPMLLCDQDVGLHSVSGYHR